MINIQLHGQGKGSRKEMAVPCTEEESTGTPEVRGI